MITHRHGLVYHTKYCTCTICIFDVDMFGLLLSLQDFAKILVWKEAKGCICIMHGSSWPKLVWFLWTIIYYRLLSGLSQSVFFTQQAGLYPGGPWQHQCPLSGSCQHGGARSVRTVPTMMYGLCPLGELPLYPSHCTKQRRQIIWHFIS